MHLHRTPQDQIATPVGHHERALLLGQVSLGGVRALFQAFRQAARDPSAPAARMPVASLLRAVPGVGALTAHELMTAAGIREGERLNDLRPGQLVALLRIVDRLPAPPGGG